MTATVLATTNLPSYRVYCRASPNYNLAVNGGILILAPMDKNDERQHWYKDDTHSDEKDIWGFPAFSLINKATGQTLKHFFDHFVPVRLVPYNPDLDKSILWALAEDRGEGFKAIRSLQAQSHLEAAPLNDYSYHGAINIGGKWMNAPNQQWKIEPHS